MKLLHLGDLHFGKRIQNLSLIEDQKYILKVILNIITEQKIDGVMLAGDIYDKSIPSEEAVALFDDFLVSLASRKIPVFIISGNHDSVERLSFADRLMEVSEIYISHEYDGSVKKVTLKDDCGPINFYLLPFIKPVHVKKYFDEEIKTYTEAMNLVIDKLDVDENERNIMISHQFVTGASLDGSEDELSVGGLDNVDAWVYEKFDYTALGHIHRPQKIKENIRYSGSPIKFSFDEESQNKSVTIVDIKEKGNITIETLPLKALRDFITLKGTFNELLENETLHNSKDFIHIVLTDEEDVPNAFSTLCKKYPNLLSLNYDNKRVRNTNVVDGANVDLNLGPVQLFSQFYKLRNDMELNEEQDAYIKSLIESIWG